MRNLPEWVTRNDKGEFLVDPDVAFPAILELLGVPDDQTDQYWLEVAYQIAKMKVQEIAAQAGHDWKKKALVIHIQSHDGRKERWAHANHPKGRGVLQASKGLEAKTHFQAVRYRL